jgi:hypothetical protein
MFKAMSGKSVVRLTSWCNNIAANIPGHQRSRQILHHRMCRCLTTIVNKIPIAASESASAPHGHNLTLGFGTAGSHVDFVACIEKSHESKY